MNRTWAIVACLGALWVAAVLVVAGASASASEPPDASEPWIRISEDEDRVLYLDVAARTFHDPNDASAPTVTLVGAVHIGEKRFYASLQEYLDAFDLVLYEGVNPAGSGELPANLSPRERIERTDSRLRLLAILIERHRMEHESLPESLDALDAALEAHPRQRAWLEAARDDAWGNPVALMLEDDGTYDIVSLGADGVPGGKRADADRRYAEQEPLSNAELGVEPALQQRLAETFRLEFQLDEMDETGPNWRNADMDLDELQDRLGAGGNGEGDTLIFDLLDGSSAMARMASGILSLIERLPGAAPRGRMMIMEMLSLADESMIAASTPGGEALVDVIIGDRNQVVVDDLRDAIEEEAPPNRIAIIYGAGHMPDLEQRMAEQLGYVPTGDTRWTTAMRLPLERVGITPQERMLLRATLIKQLEEARAAAD